MVHLVSTYGYIAEKYKIKENNRIIATNKGKITIFRAFLVYRPKVYSVAFIKVFSFNLWVWFTILINA